MTEAYGSLLAEMGEEEQAIAMLKKAIELSPEAGHEKYMYLGQLLEGGEALTMTRKGIDLLQQQLDHMIAEGVEVEGGAAEEPSGSKRRAAKSDDEGEEEDMDGVEKEEEDEGEEEEEGPTTVEELREGLCSALCSLAEMVMGQTESLEAGGEACEEVEALLARAAATCGASPEPGQAMASLRYEQGRPEEALAQLQGSMKLWFRGAEDEEGDEEGMAAEGAAAAGRRDEDEDAAQPSYEFRFECAKLLLELDEATDSAIQVCMVQGQPRGKYKSQPKVPTGLCEFKRLATLQSPSVGPWPYMED